MSTKTRTSLKGPIKPILGQKNPCPKGMKYLDLMSKKTMTSLKIAKLYEIQKEPYQFYLS
jgi:hypothetical protein